MISIPLHLSGKAANVQDFLDELSENMWRDLNPQRKKGEYKKSALTKRLEQLYQEIKGQPYKDRVGVADATRHLNYCDYLSSQGVLKRLITAKPGEFDSIINKSREFLNDDDFLKTIDGRPESYGFGKLLLRKVFNYENYRGSQHCHKRFSELGFTEATCPYCNENAVKIVRAKNNTRSGELLMLCDIDHFYSKQRYPYLALSFYNHIPSCKTCNQTYKGDKSFSIATHIHPYVRCFDSSYTFKFNAGILAGDPISSVKLKNISGLADELAQDLGLESRYFANLTLARTPKLIEILRKNSHLFTAGNINDSEREYLIELLSSFGVTQNKEKIISNLYGKFHRDIVKMFDINGCVYFKSL